MIMIKIFVFSFNNTNEEKEAAKFPKTIVHDGLFIDNQVKIINVKAKHLLRILVPNYTWQNYKNKKGYVRTKNPYNK